MIFMNFQEISEILLKGGFASSLECQAAQPLLFPKGNQGFVKGCGWLKTQNIMVFIRNYEIITKSMEFHLIAAM